MRPSARLQRNSAASLMVVVAVGMMTCSGDKLS
jgi:hypothetical protein